MLTRRALTLAVVLTAAVLSGPRAAQADSSSTRLFFLADTNLDGVTTGLFRANADGTGRVAMLPERPGVFLNNLALSPDGSQLVYERFDSSSATVWTISAAGFDNRKVATFGPDDGVRLNWSPDGKQLIYTNSHAATPQVTLLTLATGAKALVPRSVNVMHPVFDPSDPTTIYGSISNDRIVRMPVSGAHSPTVVAPSIHKADYPQVSHDGTQVLYEHIEADDTASIPDETLNLIDVADGTTRPAVTGKNNTRGSFSQDGKTIYFDHFADQAHDFIGDLWSVPADRSAAAAPIQQTSSIDEFYLSGGNVDVTPPGGSVTGLTAVLNGAHPVLRWSASSDPDAAYAIVCRSAGTTAPTSPDTCGGSLAKSRVTTFTDSVTAGQTYSYSVFTADGYGNENPKPVSITLTALAPPALRAASAVGVTGPFNVAWSSAGSTSYDTVWTTRPGPSYALAPFQPWLTATTSTSSVFGQSDVPTAVGQGVAYTLRAVAADAYGNRTLSSSAIGAVPLDQTKASYAGSWATLSGSDRYLGSVAGSSAAGASASISLVGSSYRIVGDRCPACGSMRVYVDGTLAATVSTSASALRTRQLLWSSGALGSIAARTVRVVVEGTAGSPRVALDGFVSVR